MPEFRFRLEKLLRLRQGTRDQRRLRLAEAQRADEELRGQLVRLAAEQDRLQGQCRQAAAPGAVDLDRLVEADRYAAVLRGEEAELHRQRETLAAEIQTRRDTLLQADREVRTLEKLRDRQQQRYRQEEQRRESKLLDERGMCSSRSA
jgi:flagellar export protein FliJ